VKRLWIIPAFVALSWAVAPAEIGTDAQIKTALDITTQDLTRLSVAVGRHQNLRDAQGNPRAATTAEAIAELKSRANDLVRREEAKVGADTVGQWGGI
jgi:hypothetical protein